MSAKRILVVDDNALSRRLATVYLGEAGFEVQAASSGEEALRLALETPPDAVLSDIRMAGMDGFELRDAMVRDVRLARIPVVLVSNSGLDDPYVAGRGPMVVDRTPDFSEAIAAVRAAIDTAQPH